MTIEVCRWGKFSNPEVREGSVCLTICARQTREPSGTPLVVGEGRFDGWVMGKCIENRTRRILAKSQPAVTTESSLASYLGVEITLKASSTVLVSCDF